MKEALIKFVRARGGDVLYKPALFLENWPNYKLVGFYLYDGELHIVSVNTFGDIESHLDQRWEEVIESYQKAVCDAAGVKMNIDHNLFAP